MPEPTDAIPTPRAAPGATVTPVASGASDALASLSLDDAIYIELLRAGDARAFERMVRELGPRMLAVATRLTGDDALAQDAVQDAFISAFRHLPEFDGRAKLSTWLHRVTVNAALMLMRKRTRRREASLDGLLPRFKDDGHPVETPAPWTPDAASRLESEEMKRALRDGIEALPDHERVVLVLRDIEGLDTAATAAALSIPEGTVKVRLHRARQALRTILDQRLRNSGVASGDNDGGGPGRGSGQNVRTGRSA